MSVIIKGMKMPTGCNDCRRYYWSSIDQEYKCRLTDTGLQVKNAMVERSVDCPLVEIPKGARLIDTDILYDRIIQRFDVCDDFLEMLEDVPTIFEED